MNKIFFLFFAGLSIQVWGLQVSEPITISDLNTHMIRACKADINEQGDATVAWISANYRNRDHTLQLSFKKADSRWGDPETASPAYVIIDKFRIAVSDQGNVLAGCAVKSTQGDAFQLFHRDEAGWHGLQPHKSDLAFSDPNWMLTKQQEVIFAKSISVPEFNSMQSSRWMPLAFVGSFAAAELEACRLDEVISYSDPKLFIGADGKCALAVWEFDDSFYCSWRDEGVWSKPELVCLASTGLKPDFYSLSARISGRRTATIAFEDEENEEYYAVFYKNDHWSAPVNITPSKNSVLDKLAVDREGNTLFVWHLDRRGLALPVSFYDKGQDQVRSLSFPALPGVSIGSQVDCDDLGNFVVVWLHLGSKKCEVYAGVYAIETGMWSKPVRLSAEGIVCSDVKLAMNGSGKGVVAWIANHTLFDRNVQVVELDTSSSR